MIIWAKVPVPKTAANRFLCHEPVRDPSLTYEIGHVLGGHVSADGTLHVQIELDEKALIDRLSERRGAF